MEQENHSAQDLVQQLEIRRVYDKETERWYYSIVDAIAVLTDTLDLADYWTKLKRRAKTGMFETVLRRVAFRSRLVAANQRASTGKESHPIPASQKGTPLSFPWLLTGASRGGAR